MGAPRIPERTHVERQQLALFPVTVSLSPPPAAGQQAQPGVTRPAKVPAARAGLFARLGGLFGKGKDKLAPEEDVQPGPIASAVGGTGILAVSGLRKTYGARNVVSEASLYVRNGEAVGLLGPNGAGKTTIFYMITGLVSADMGVISLEGNDITTLPMYQRARLGIGYLPQEASIFRGLSVEDNIRAVLEVVEPNRKKRERELDKLLDEFNIARLRKAPSIALSGGERRRCEIARALAGRPSFILLDEPFAGIDPIAVGDIQELVRQLTDRGIGVLITDHNVRETLGLVDRAYIIHSGRVLTEGSPAEIIANADVRRVYLGEDFRL
ncbi:LPS export ABC transporter ATP-binding protein [Boseaceae bacterium BT-24-1]|nr:LPS export ABC transporter ATP-binding protein [Boseaceae bacterium BT-24-1]